MKLFVFQVLKGSSCRLGCVLLIALGLTRVLSGAEVLPPAGPVVSPSEQITFVRLRIREGQVELLSATNVPGKMKALRRDPNAAFPYRAALETGAGASVWAETFADPRVRRVEVEDPNHPGSLQAKFIETTEAEMVLRVPAHAEARQLSVYRRVTRGPGLAANAPGDAELLGRFQLPAKGSTP